MAQYDTITEADREMMATAVSEIPERPVISVILPVHDPPVTFLASAIDSVLGQIYEAWELCVVDDCSEDDSVTSLLVDSANQDHRIKLHRLDRPSHVAAASNAGLDLATGSWVTFLDHDDELAAHALGMIALVAAKKPNASVVYSDEDLIDEPGNRIASYFKADFDPLLLLGMNHLCHLVAYRREIVERVGRFREGFEGSQDWDLALRATEHLPVEQVVHVPHPLYHWRRHSTSTACDAAAKPYAAGAGHRAVEERVRRQEPAATVEPIPGLGWNRVRWPVADPAPLVTVIIVVGDGDPAVEHCVKGIVNLTTYPNYELLLVTQEASLLSSEWFADYASRLWIIEDGGRLAWWSRARTGIWEGSGEILCFVDQACEVVTGDWLSEMVGQLLQPEVGAVGARVVSEGGQLFDAGLVLGLGGVAGPALAGIRRTDIGYWGRAALPRRVGAVSGACMAVRRSALEDVGGFGEELEYAFFDVDLCLRLANAGWKVVWTPFAEFRRRGDPSTEGVAGNQHDGTAQAADRSAMLRRWGRQLEQDRAYNPNLSLDTGDFSPADPPRLGKLDLMTRPER